MCGASLAVPICTQQSPEREDGVPFVKSPAVCGVGNVHVANTHS